MVCYNSQCSRVNTCANGDVSFFLSLQTISSSTIGSSGNNPHLPHRFVGMLLLPQHSCQPTPLSSTMRPHGSIFEQKPSPWPRSLPLSTPPSDICWDRFLSTALNNIKWEILNVLVNVNGNQTPLVPFSTSLRLSHRIDSSLCR